MKVQTRFQSDGSVKSSEPFHYWKGVPAFTLKRAAQEGKEVV